jgi:hypothetical protein
MVGPLGVLVARPAAATTRVRDVIGGPPGGADGMSDSGHHRSWRRQWRAPRGVLVACPRAATTRVGDIDSSPLASTMV